MKHGKIFAKIVYFLFTFTIGIMLAVFLPYIYMSDGEYLNIMESSLKKGKYSEAMLLVGGYFDDREVLLQNFDNGGGIVLFCAATLVYSEDENVVDESLIHKSYAGFVYGVAGKYNVTAETNNQTKLQVEDGSGNEHIVSLLDADMNDDGRKDTIATYYTNGFFFLELDEETFSSIRTLTFIDKDGTEFGKITSLNLNFEEQFFTDVNEFIDEYNSDYNSDKLPDLNDELLAKSGNYKISSLGVAKSKADAKSAIIVVVYFICVYLIADLLWYRFTIRFFKWLLFKVCKIKCRQKKQPKRSEVFGNDYFCQVTFELDVSDVDGFAESVQIRYTDNKGEEISFILLKQENYKSTQCIKAGTYVNMWIDINRTEYATKDLPETLLVEGYRKAFKIKILRREEKRDENFNSAPDQSVS